MESTTTYDSSYSSKENYTKRIDNNYILYLSKKLGKGGFGQIYMGENTETNEKVAIKIELLKNNNHKRLINEFEILKYLQGSEGFPKLYKFVKTNSKNLIIMELLGNSLEQLFNNNNRIFSIKTIFQIGYQMLQRIELLHCKGFIHRDMKPGNFLIGIKNKSKIYLIDFGLSKRYIDNFNKHIAYREGKGLTGTAHYVSIFTHNGIEQSRRDDLEGIAYMLIYFCKGKLPWQGIHAKKKKEKHKKIMEKKKSITPEELCNNLPKEILLLLKYSRTLPFEERPDYNYIKLLMIDGLKNLGFIYDNKFDWNNE
jgi:serine/threonine protein kinase